MASKTDTNPSHDDGASPGKIFIGGIPKDTTNSIFNKHFGKYGEITDSVIMKDRFSGQPRGFGFITYADPSVVDKVIEDTHVINGKQVEIKRTIPKGARQSNDFKTRKIFVGGIPSDISDDKLESFFSEYGKVTEHQIMRDRETGRSRGFAFVVFDSEEVVDDLLSKGNMIEMEGTQVEIKKAEPKKPSNNLVASTHGSKSRAHSFGDNSYAGYGGSYGGFDPSNSYSMTASIGGRLGYGSYGSYSAFGDGSLGGYGARFGPYGAGFSGAFGGGNYFGRSAGYGSYGSSGYGSSYDASGSTGYSGASGYYGKGGYSGASRYHPYTR